MADFDSKLPVRALSADFKVDLDLVKGTATDVSTGNATAGTQRVVLASDQPAVSVSLAANQSVNVAQIAGTATTVNTGNASNGTQRVVIASDQPAVSVSLAANQSVNVAQIAGTATAVNTGNATNGTQRVVIASDQPSLPFSFSNTTSELVLFSTATKGANATNTQTYSPATTKYLDQVDASASGQLKVEVKTGTTGLEATRWVGFTSKGNLHVSWRLPNPIVIPNTDSVVVVVTNFDNQSQDVYSSIMVH